MLNIVKCLRVANPAFAVEKLGLDGGKLGRHKAKLGGCGEFVNIYI